MFCAVRPASSRAHALARPHHFGEPVTTSVSSHVMAVSGPENTSLCARWGRRTGAVGPDGSPGVSEAVWPVSSVLHVFRVSSARAGDHSSLPKAEPQMIRKNSFMCRSIVAAALAAVLLCPVGARGGIVFGNLGPTGSTPLGTTGSNIGSQSPVDINWIAQGFKTGPAPNLTVSTITLGVSAANSELTVSIFPDVSGVPSTLALYTSSATTVGVKDKYAFSFSSAVLEPNKNYFVVLNGGLWWYNTGVAPAPIEQNGSGYTSTGTLQSFNTGASPSGPWSTAESSRYSVSVEAVPEPSAIVMAGLGVASLAILARSRKIRGKKSGTVEI